MLPVKPPMGNATSHIHCFAQFIFACTSAINPFAGMVTHPGLDLPAVPVRRGDYRRQCVGINHVCHAIGTQYHVT